MKKTPGRNSYPTGDFSNLRIQAEKTLLDIEQDNVQSSPDDVKLLFQELQIHQIELEMQNDELRVANEELERQQIKSTGIYDLAPIGYFILDRNGIVEDVNHAGISLLDVRKSNILNRPLHPFIVAGERDEYYLFFHRLLANQVKQSCRLKMVSGTGREFYALLEGIAISHFAAEGIHCYLALLDDTDRIEAGYKQAETSERLQLALEASAAGIWELEVESMKFYLDEFSYKLCAYPGSRFNGTYPSFIKMVYADDRAAVDQHFRAALNQDSEIDIVCRVINVHNQLGYASIRGHIVSEAGRPNRFVGIMLDISEKKKAVQEAVILKRNQEKSVALAILKTQENERKRISHSLHDGVSQLLYGIKMKLGQLPVKQPGILKSINELLDAAVSEVRNISFELAPSILTDFGLPTTIDELTKRLSTPDMRIKTKFIGLETRMDLNFEIGIFRIVQELLNNCMKHSGAGMVRLEIKKNKTIDIKVMDNGKGFNVKEQEDSPGGTGLSSIRNRVNLYNGSMTLDSVPGKGTTVLITLRTNVDSFAN